jgi:chromosome segregation ATPase
LQEVEQATHRLAMEKYGLIEQKAAMLRLIGKYGEVKDGKYRMTLSVDSVSAELQKAQDKNLKIRTLLQRLRVECPEVATQIDKIVATM